MEIIPERKFDEACFFYFSPRFSVKFAHFDVPVEGAFTIG
jgi:hypothetical protein